MRSALAGAAVSAVLLGLFARCAAPFHVLGFVALAPWLVGLGRARSLAAALVSAAALAMGFTALGFAWFPATVAGYGHAGPAVSWAITLALAPILIQPQLLVVAAGRHLGAGPLATALLYTGAEWALPKLFRDTLGYGLYPAETLRQAADLAGVRGLTLLVVFTAAALASRRMRPIAVAAAATAAATVYGAVRLPGVRAQAAAAPVLRAGVVQANITRYDKLAATAGTYEAVARILGAHFELSERLLKEGPLDVVVWPETTYPTTFGAPHSEDGAAFDRAIAGFVGTHRLPLVFGAFEREGAAEYNAAFFLAPRGEHGIDFDTYRKSLLFPMTEAVPSWLDGPRLRRALPWTGRFTPGPGPRVVALGDLAVGTLICYEVTDPGYVAATARAGAAFLLVLSNDAWFPSPEAPRLHLVMAAFRAIETRRAELRATNSGMSALILPDGTLAQVTDFGARAAFRAAVPIVGGRTLVTSWGDWLGPTSLALALALFAAARLRARRSRSRLPRRPRAGGP